MRYPVRFHLLPLQIILQHSITKILVEELLVLLRCPVTSSDESSSDGASEGEIMLRLGYLKTEILVNVVFRAGCELTNRFDNYRGT